MAVVARIRPGSNVPDWEQEASAACAGYAITLAAAALGLGAVWKSTPFRDGPLLREVLGMDAADRFLGWVNVGTPTDAGEPGERLPPDDVAFVLDPDGALPPFAPVDALAPQNR